MLERKIWKRKRRKRKKEVDAVEPAPPAPNPAAGAHTGLTDEELAGLDATALAAAAAKSAAAPKPSSFQGRVLLWRDRQAPSQPRPRHFKRNSANFTGLTKSLLVTTCGLREWSWLSGPTA